jgi:hypothetical protein
MAGSSFAPKIVWYAASYLLQSYDAVQGQLELQAARG